MGLLRLLLFLVPFILLGGVQEPGLVEGLLLNSCPKVRVKCEVEERNLCSRHKDCPNNMRCCMFSCGKKCLNLKKDVCNMPKEVGPCMAYLPRWWYNKETELCSRFIYGGCQGNNNNFQSESICMVICKKSQLPPKPAMSRGSSVGLEIQESNLKPTRKR